jgi:hypothetical protein
MRNRYCGHSFETRPGEETRDPADPGLSKKKGWELTRSTWRVDPVGPGKPGWDPGLFYIYIYSWPKREKQRNERNAEDLINFKPNSRNLQTYFSREEEQRSRRLLNPWSLFQI